MKRAPVTIEFYGIPRRRAGRASVAVEASTVAEALAAAERTCPGLTGLMRADGTLAPHIAVALDGREFISNLQRALRIGDRLVLLSADAGG